MALLTTGKGFIRDLERSGALAVYTPLEGGSEGRYLRRLRAAGYQALTLSAKGLGDLSAYLTDIHGVRPPHLGKKTIGQEAAVGPIYFATPIAGTFLDNLSPKAKGMVLWLLEGYALSRTERDYLVNLTKQDPRIKIVIEMGGDRYFRWQPLSDLTKAA